MAEVIDYLQKSSLIFDRYSGVILFSVFLTLLTFLLVNIAIFDLWAFGDLGIPPADLQTFYERTFYIWQSEGIGSVRTPIFNVNVMMLIASTFIGSTVASKMALLSTFVISYGFCYYLLRSLGMRPLICFTGATLYSINPVTIAAFIGGEISEVMTFAVFPALTYLLARIFTHRKHIFKRLSILTVLTFALVWNIYVAFWYGVLVAIPLIICLLLVARKKGLGLRLRRMSIRASLIAVILVAIFIPTIVIIQNKTPAASQESFVNDALFTYRGITLDHALRMAGNTGSAQENLGYNEFNTFTIFGSVITFLAIAPLIFLRYRNLSNMQLIFLISCAASFALIIALLFIVKANPNIVDSSLIFASLRNPKKLLFPLVFALTILFSLSTGRILSAFKRDWIKYMIVCGLIGMILLSNYPALDGTLGLKSVRKTTYAVDGRYATIPSLLANLDSEYKQYNVFVFPWQYDTLLRIRSSIPNYFGTQLGAGTDGVNVGEFKTMFELIGKNSTTKHGIFMLYNVKYIVIDKQFDLYPDALRNSIEEQGFLVYPDHDSYWATGNPDYLFNILVNDPFFERAYEDNQFAIFKVVQLSKPTIVSKVVDTDKVLNGSFETRLLDIGESGFGSEGWGRWPSDLVSTPVEDDLSGNRSLQMRGQADYWSNVHRLIPISEYANYRFKFDVKLYNTTDAHAKLIWYGQNDRVQENNAIRTDYVRLYSMGLAEDTWHTIETEYVSPMGARFVDVQLLASRTNDKYSSTLTSYDNVSLSEASQLSVLPADDISRVTPTVWKAAIDLDKPTRISFAQSYDPAWELRTYIDGQLQETVRSSKFFGIINAFDVQTIGKNVELELVYTPQGELEMSMIILLIVLLPACACLLYDPFMLLRRKLVRI